MQINHKTTNIFAKLPATVYIIKITDPDSSSIKTLRQKCSPMVGRVGEHLPPILNPAAKPNFFYPLLIFFLGETIIHCLLAKFHKK